ncbi:MAG: protein kinase, partial [Leptolyngbyaceae cyanobacterium bins.302]|nr:protein kinase [Leptolyngbyaceae cyanobacterium bins.302]
MNKSLPDYTFKHIIYEGVETRIYAGVKDSDHQSVVIKLLKADYPSPRAIAQLKQEYQLLESLNISGIIRPLAVENYQNGLALVLEDFGGLSLQEFLQPAPLELDLFLNVAIQLAATLAELHQNRIIHKDI